MALERVTFKGYKVLAHRGCTILRKRDITVEARSFDSAWDLAVARHGKTGLFLTNHLSTPQQEVSNVWSDEDKARIGFDENGRRFLPALLVR